MRPCGPGCGSWRRCAGASATGGCMSADPREGMLMNHKKLRRLYREERLQVRRRGGRKRALGTRAPMALPQGRTSAGPGLRQRHADRRPAVPDPGRGRRLHPGMPGLVADTSLSGSRVVPRARCRDRSDEATGDDRHRQRHRADQHGDPALVAGATGRVALHRPRQADSRMPSSKASTAGCATSC